MKNLLVTLLFFSTALFAFGQVPTVQDCNGAIPVCQNVYYEANSYVGVGNIPGEINSANSCLGGGEVNDVWYTFTVQSSGNLCFSITPNVSADDYDWAVFDLTNDPCSAIATNPALEVSCNFSGISGVTGANGNAGAQNNPCFPVTAGSTFVLNVSNWSGTGNGYTLDFGASTAAIFDNIPPAIQNVQTPIACGATTITFTFSEAILCSSLSTADLVLNGPGGPYTITNVTGVVCAAGGNQENEFTITVNPAITTAGNYTLDLVPGAGFVTDLCGNVASAGSLPFVVSNTIGWNILWGDETCAGDNDGTIDVSGTGGTAPYNFTIDDGSGPIASGTGSYTNLSPGTYTVVVTDANGCSATTTVTIAPGIACCGADAGTTTSSMSGQGNTNFILCDGDFIDICSMNDFVHPADVGPIGPYSYNPALGYGVYTCPPTPGLDPLSDPCFVGMVPGSPGVCMQDQNVSGSAAGLLGGILAGPGPYPTNNILYYAPITLYDGPALAYNTNCVEVGPYTTVQYLEPITYTATEDCANQQWDIVITGGHPNMFGGNFTVNNLVVTPANGAATLSAGTVIDGGTVSVNGLVNGDSFTFDITDPNGCTIQVTGGPYTCCPAFAGTSTGTLNGQGTNNFILCDGDIIDITVDGNAVNSPGTNPGITFGIYTCPPTPGIDPATDPCYTGYVTGTIGSMSDQNMGGASGGLIGAIIASGPPTPVTNSTLYYAPFTLTDQGALLYDPNCFDVGPPIAVQYLEPITFTATEDCANLQWDITVTGGYANATGGNFTISNLVVTPANGSATLSAGTIPDGGTVSVDGLVYGDNFTFDVTDGNGCTIQVTGGPYTCCPANAGTSTASMTGQGTNNFILCDGDVINIQTDGNHVNSPGAAPGITFGIYTCPPTPGIDPATDPCYTGFVTGTIWSMSDMNVGGSSGGLLAAIIGSGPPTPVSNNTLYFAPFTLTDTTGLLYDPNCFDVGPPISVQYLEPIVTTPTPSASTCGNADGAIDVASTGGMAPLQYEVIGVAGPQASSNFPNLPSGTYDVVTHDSNGCTDTVSTTIMDAGAPTITSVTPTDPTCFGVCDGTIVVVAANGVAPLSYDIGAAPQANGTFNAVCSGVYTVTVTDANGCQVTQNVTVFDPPQLTLASSHVDLTCFQVNTGSIDMIGGGGTPPYTYSIDNGVTFVAGSSFINLAAGNYDIVIMDNNGCTVTGTETITEPTELTMTFSTFDASCAGFCDGSAIVIPAGGTLPYVYTWTNGIAGPNDAQASNLCAGTETLTVTDGNGCTIDTTFTINAPTAVTIDAVAVTDVSCNGICDGSIDITAPLATTFSIDNGVNFQASNVFNGLCPGTFDIVVENANGCQATQQVVIAAPAPVTITVSADTTICVGGTATLTGNAAGGSGGFVYVWDNGLAPNQTVSVLPGMQTTYCVYAVDANGCQSPTVCVDVSIAAPLTVSVSPSVASICPGENITLTATGTGGDGNYVFNWDNGMTGSSITVSPATTTVYTVTISDGCSSPSATNFAVVNVNPIPTVLVSADITEGCLPLTVTFTNLSSPASIGGNCLWDIGPVTSTDCNTFTYTYTQAGSYDVSLTFDSPDGCTGTITLPGYINVYDNPIANFDCEPQPTTILNPVIDFTNTSSSDAVFFDWAFDIYGTSNDENPSFVFDDSIPLNYQVCLEVANQWGCIDDTCKIVEIQGEFIFYAPNAFTPDGDGINDYFFPVGSGFDNESFEFMIFNRWGELIFESSDANQQWDGRYKGLDCKQDVYIWKIKAKSDWTAEKHEYYGHVTLLR